MKYHLKWKIPLEGINNWLDTKKEEKKNHWFESIAMETMPWNRGKKDNILVARGQYQVSCVIRVL